jgi:Mrp family chromosome partitioning ATPase
VSLARSLALSGHRTLLLDCDFRRPTVHRHFGSEAVPGLVDCLRQEVSYEDLIRCDERSGLYYATAGSPCRDPQKMLDSSLGTTVLHALMARFEVTIIDSPPTMVASDCVVLARGADLTLHIAAWSRTPRGAVRAGVDYLRSRGCRVAGVVLSRIDIERAGRGGDYVDYAFRPGSGYLVE